MEPRDIVAIGGSAGSIEALKRIISVLPPTYVGTVFVVVHVSPGSRGMLARLLSDSADLPVTIPLDGEQIQRGHVYVARPDHHLTVEYGKIRVQRGPRENRHRPAIDPLMRTAAREYGPRVVGIVLSGLQDDGSAGLYTVKRLGGLTIVQDPADATWKDMPRHAIKYSDPDFIMPAREIGPLLTEIANAGEGVLPMAKKSAFSQKSNHKNGKRKPAGKARVDNPAANEEVAFPDESQGEPSVFACPECHGVLWELKDDKITRFRCRVGHSFGPDSLSRELSAASESALWAAVRALEEKAALHRRVAEAMGADLGMSSRLLDQSEADVTNARLIRNMIFRGDSELESEEAEYEKNFNPTKKKSA